MSFSIGRDIVKEKSEIQRKYPNSDNVLIDDLLTQVRSFDDALKMIEKDNSLIYFNPPARQKTQNNSNNRSNTTHTSDKSHYRQIKKKSDTSQNNSQFSKYVQKEDPTPKVSKPINNVWANINPNVTIASKQTATSNQQLISPPPREEVENAKSFNQLTLFNQINKTKKKR